MPVKTLQHLAIFLATLAISPCVLAQKAPASPAPAIREVKNIPYYNPEGGNGADPEKRCFLDLKLPADKKGFPTLVWFHGGGLTGGNRDFPQFQGQGVALVSAGYRLSPQVPCPVFIKDAAAAVAWTLKNIESYGGDPKKVFIGGHSAGGYLALMVGMDPHWLKAFDASPSSLAGLLPVSAQVTTHFHVKELQGNKEPSLVPVIDQYAPLRFASKDLPPICLVTGDRHIEFKSRVEENELFYITLKNLGHPAVEFHELKDLDHNTVTRGAAPLLPAFITQVCKTLDPAGH